MVDRQLSAKTNSSYGINGIFVGEKKIVRESSKYQNEAFAYILR